MASIAAALVPRRRPLSLRRVAGVPIWLALLVAAFALWPTSLGGSVSYIQVSGSSMEPTMHTGDLAVLRRQPSYDVGDIVAFRIPKGAPGEGFLVIHRIIGGSEATGYRLQGDNRSQPDVWRPTNGDVVGVRWALVPRAGSPVGLLANPLLLAVFLGALTVVLVATYKPKRDQKNELAAHAS